MSESPKKDVPTDADLRSSLSDEEYHVLREAGTERPWSGEYVHAAQKGMYRCKVCGAELFSSDTKFESGTGWPSFYDVAQSDAVTLIEDTAHGMIRTEVRCANCGSHLGHVFPDAPDQPTGQRYCINSVCLTLDPADTQT